MHKNNDNHNSELLSGKCHGMFARIVVSQCLNEFTDTLNFSNNLKDIFNFASNLVMNEEMMKEEYPALAYIDYHGHTAIDGLSYAQLIEIDLPKLEKMAVKYEQRQLASLISELLKFIEKVHQGGDHKLLIFDGM